MVVSRNRQIKLTKKMAKEIADLAAKQYESNSELARISTIHRNSLRMIMSGKWEYIGQKMYERLCDCLEGLE